MVKARVMAQASCSVRVVGWGRVLGAPRSRWRVAAGGVDGCDGEQESREGVEAERFEQMAVEQCGESASGAAAGAVQVQILVNGTLRVEVVLRGGIEQQQCGRCEDGDGRGGQSRDAARWVRRDWDGGGIRGRWRRCGSARACLISMMRLMW